MFYLTLVAAVAFGVARLLMPVESQVHHEDLFKDAAHIFIGLLFGAGGVCLYLRSKLNEFSSQYVIADRIGKLFWVAVALSILEVVAFKLHEKPKLIDVIPVRDPFRNATEGLTDREFRILEELRDGRHASLIPRGELAKLKALGLVEDTESGPQLTRRGRKEIKRTPAVEVTEPVRGQPTLAPPRIEPKAFVPDRPTSNDLNDWSKAVDDWITARAKHEGGYGPAPGPVPFPQRWGDVETEYDRVQYESILEVHRFYAERINRLEDRVRSLEEWRRPPSFDDDWPFVN